jgi:hypothetical protein
VKAEKAEKAAGGAKPSRAAKPAAGKKTRSPKAGFTPAFGCDVLPAIGRRHTLVDDEPASPRKPTSPSRTSYDVGPAAGGGGPKPARQQRSGVL